MLSRADYQTCKGFMVDEGVNPAYKKVGQKLRPADSQVFGINHPRYLL